MIYSQRKIDKLVDGAKKHKLIVCEQTHNQVGVITHCYKCDARGDCKTYEEEKNC